MMPIQENLLTNQLPADMHRPDYDGGSIVNLMASVAAARGACDPAYAPLRLLDDIRMADYRNILLVLIDGLGYEFLQQFPKSTVARYCRGSLTSVFPTATAAAVTTFITGLAPAQHSLTGWHVWLQEIRALAAVLPFRSRIGREPLTQRGYEPAQLFDARPIYERLETDSHVISPARIAHSVFNQAFSRGAAVHTFDGLKDFYATIERVVRADQAQKYIYAYWPDLDHTGHTHGIGSHSARRHFADIDAGFTQLISALANSDTLVLLTADHGMIDATEETRIDIEAHAALTAMLDIPLCGEPRAAYCYVHPGEDTAFENYIGSELGDVATALRSRELAASGLFGPGEPHPRLLERLGDFTLLMKEPYIVNDTVPGESPNTLIGVHGGLTSTELLVPLAVVQT